MAHSQLQDFQLRKGAPRRPLDWRFRRAVELSRITPRKRAPRSGDDRLVMQYADLLHRLHGQITYEDFDKIKKRHPDLSEVHLAYATLNKTELALLDALLLSRSPDPVLITNQSGLTASQQKLYRQIFLDVDDRRHMSLFVATQLMEPARLRNAALIGHEFSEPESLDRCDAVGEGSLPVRAQCTLRVIGFYSSPIVLEMLYAGFLSGTVPAGRDSAMRFLAQSTLTNVRRFGVFASGAVPFEEGGFREVYKLASQLAMEEKDEGQIDIIQNIEALFAQFRPRIGQASTILEREQLPREVFEGEYELSEEEMVAAMRSGTLPPTVADLQEAGNLQ